MEAAWEEQELDIPVELGFERLGERCVIAVKREEEKLEKAEGGGSKLNYMNK